MAFSRSPEPGEERLRRDLEHIEAVLRVTRRPPPSEWRLADYGWQKLERRGIAFREPAQWLFHLMSRDFAVETANYINQLVKQIDKLRAWAKQLEGINDEPERLHILAEFVDPEVHYTLSLPYALREKFYFAFAHLCNQGQRITDPTAKDDLKADHQITPERAKRYEKTCEPGERFIAAANAMTDDEFEERTSNFRNCFNHRITPGVELGSSRFVQREIPTPEEREKLPGKPKVIYHLGASSPVKLSDVIAALEHQQDLAFTCFERLKEVIWYFEDQILAQLPDLA